MACMDIISRSRSMLAGPRNFRDGEDMIPANAPDILRQPRYAPKDDQLNPSLSERRAPVAHKRPTSEKQRIEQLCRELMENPSHYRNDEPMIDISKLPEVVGNKRFRTDSNTRSVKKPRKSATSGIQNAIEECRDLFGDPESRNEHVPQSISPTNNLISPRDTKRTAKRVRNGSTPLKRPSSAREDAPTPQDLSPDVCTPMNNFSPKPSMPLRSKAPQSKPKSEPKLSLKRERSQERTSDSSARAGNVSSSNTSKPARVRSATPLRSKKETVKSERKRDSGKENLKERGSDSSTAPDQVSPPRQNPLRSKVMLVSKPEPKPERKDEIMVDVKREPKRAPSRDSKRESVKDVNVDLKRESKLERELKRESKRDSKRDSKREAKRESKRDSKRDSKKESKREYRKEVEPSKYEKERESSRREDSRRDESEREKYRRDESDRERGRTRDRERDRDRDRERDRESSKREKSRRDEYDRDETRRERSRRDDSRREDSRRERSTRDEPRRERSGRDDSRRGDAMLVEARRSELRRDDSRRDEGKRDGRRRETSRDGGRRDEFRREDDRRERTRKEESRRDESRRDEYRRKDGHRDESRKDERRRSESRREESKRDDSRRVEIKRESKTSDKMEDAGGSKTEDRTFAKAIPHSKAGHALPPSVASLGKSSTSVPLSRPAPPPLRSSSVTIPTSRPAPSATGATVPRFTSRPMPVANGTGSTKPNQSPDKRKPLHLEYNEYKAKAIDSWKEKNYDEYEKNALKACNISFEWGLAREKEHRKQEKEIRASEQLRDRVMKDLREHYEFCKKRTRDHIQNLEDIKRNESAAILKRLINKANLRVSMLTAQWVLPQARTLQTMTNVLARVEAASASHSERGSSSSDSRLLSNQEVRTMQKVLSEYTNVVEIYNRVVSSGTPAEVQEPGTECTIQ